MSKTVARPPLNRIPGGQVSMPLAQQENHIKDLSKLTRLELLDLKAREAKLLANKAKLQRLPDKGKRIQDFYDKIEAELERRSNVDEAAALFSSLNIAAKGQKTLNELEWRGRLNGNENLEDATEDVLDSDDETEMDPLRIIAQRTMHERKTKILPPEPQLITEQDLKEIKELQESSNHTDSGVESPSENNSHSTDNAEDVNDEICPKVEAEIIELDVDKIKPKLQEVVLKSPKKSTLNNQNVSSNLEPHCCYLVAKTELEVQPQTRQKFLPFKTTKSNVHDPEKERNRKQHKHWEVTAATPPPIQHNGAQMISLLDSVETQAKYLAKLKALQEQQAAERLAARMERAKTRQIHLNSDDLQKPAFSQYREPSMIKSKSVNLSSNIEGNPNLNKESEEFDDSEMEKPEGLGITYTVYE